MGQYSEKSIANPVLLTFSKMEYQHGDINTVHTHAFTEIFIFESGKGYFECGKKREIVGEGDVVLVRAGERHYQQSVEKPLTYYCYAVSEIFDDGNFPSPDGYLILRGEKTEEIIRLNNQCLQELNGDRSYKMSMILALVKLMLVEIIRGAGLDGNCDATDEVRDYIRLHYAEEITLDRLCKIFYTNKSTLLHTFKKNHGVSPLQYRNINRIEMAKKLILSGKNVTETAMDVGFSNPVYFTETFKKFTGLTPMAYKKFAMQKENTNG
ncbi:MAG: helix-turn-helix domain-containing protein [Clostridia bacterium]|nr:helix-turn-helix domain-containing protein [Clostridia bacterium]